MNTNEKKTCYVLSPAQDVCYLQCKYSLHKRVINILSSTTFKEKLDIALLNKAYKLLVQRNDCLRLKFFNKNGRLMQYFRSADEMKINDVPVLTFTTEAEQQQFILNVRKKAIDYKRGIVIEPYFINTFDGRFMIFFKTCHLALDIYGIRIMYGDLLGIYNALKNGTELPTPTASFEEIIKKDIEHNDKDSLHQKHLDFFTDLLNNNPEPYYAGIHGPENKVWQKQIKNGHHGMPLLIVKNDTETYTHKINRDIVNKIMVYCEQHRCSPANLLFFTGILTLGILNNKTKYLMPIGLYNCRYSMSEKNCGGTKAQSGACYTKIDYSLPFEENMQVFSAHQLQLYKHVKFSDLEFEDLIHKTYKSSPLEMYYSMSYSFFSFCSSEDEEFSVYSNGKGALPAYVVQFLNTETNEIETAYDVQTKTTSEADVKAFHEKYVHVLEQVLDDPYIIVDNITLS